MPFWTKENPAGASGNRSVRAIIFVCAAALASAALFYVFIALSEGHHHVLAAFAMLGAIASVIALSLAAGRQDNENRIAHLVALSKAANEARQLAESGAQEKSRLLATVSHEIRTPLNGVIGMLDLVLETKLNEEQLNYVRTAKGSGRTLLSIVDEILDTAKSQATHQDKPSLTHIRSVGENVVELLSPRAHVKGIDISIHVAADVPEHVSVDEMRLRQILFNLGGNAIKFTEQGGVGISLQREGTNALLISVQDSGIGMTRDEADRIFGDFVQANHQTSQRYGGTGLGLGITKKIVEDLGGNIRVASTPKSGTCFDVRLPVLTVASQTPAQVLHLADRRFALAMPAGVTVDHLGSSIRDLGGHVTLLHSAQELKARLKHADPAETIVADSSYADVLRDWAKAQGKSPTTRQAVWIMLMAEERRTLRDLIGTPFAGYLLKPLRRSSLLARFSGQDSQSLKQAAAKLRAVARQKTSIHSLNVLVADDNQINLLLTRTMLQKSGHHVTCVNDGQAVLDLIAQKKLPDLLLLDVEMPGLDGFETARQLRAIEMVNGKVRALPILGMTAHTRREELELCLLAGMDDYLTKPFDQQDLAEAIEKVMKPRASSAKLAR